MAAGLLLLFLGHSAPAGSAEVHDPPAERHTKAALRVGSATRSKRPMQGHTRRRNLRPAFPGDSVCP